MPAVSALLLVFAVYLGKDIGNQRGMVSVRFLKDVLEAEQLEHIYQENEDSDDKEDLPYITLWNQREGVMVFDAQEEKAAKVKVVEIWGDVEQVYPECFLGGSFLSKEDEVGCMISKGAAFEIFGGVDVLYKEVIMEGEVFVIRGLLDLEEKVFLRENGDGEFSNLEAKGSVGGGTQKVKLVLSKAGVSPEEGSVIEWDLLYGVLRILWAVAFGFLEYFAAYRIVEKIGRSKMAAVCVWGVCILLFFLVIANGWCFSQDYIPARWSDFEFFGEMAEAQKENYNMYMDLPYIFKDRWIFGEVRKVVAVIFACVLCQVVVSAGRERC